MTSGAALHDLVRELYPILRSITGPGVRQTLSRVAEIVPLDIVEVPSGTPVLDWTVPDEWQLREAWIETPDGTRLVDAADHNLHVVNYSTSVDATLARDELEPHLHSLPDRPDVIPYRTSYYDRTWGFCLRHREREAMGDGPFRVYVDATLAPGSLTYGELVIPGAEPAEVLVSTHVCHPSLANDNLSGIAVATYLADWLRERGHRLTWRFVFVPGTIGSIAWLAANPDCAAQVVHGMVLSGVGDPGELSWKRSRRGDAAIDRVVAHVLGELGDNGDGARIADFTPWGYDERQYCSPGFDLPVGRLSRTEHGTYPEYHTSADDPDFVTAESLAGSLTAAKRIAEVLDANRAYRNLAPHGEPQLGRRGLYGAIGGLPDPGAAQLAMLWVLNASDGSNDLLAIAERSGIDFDVVAQAAASLLEHGLLAPADGA